MTATSALPDSVADLAQQIRSRALSPVEVMDTTLRRIEARNPSLNALVHLAGDEAMAAARQAERHLFDGGPVPPLLGVPTALKDLFGFKEGWPSTLGGIPALRARRAAVSSLWTQRMEQAGAILVGSTNSPVMGFRGTCDNYLFGPTANPFDVTRNSGGSSGGAAACVADGLLTLTEGSDGGGSLRIPAAWCGVYGFKSSFGRIPFVGRPNAFAGTSPFLFSGAITRTVADAALAMEVLAGPDPRDPFSLAERVDYVGALERDVAGLRVGFSPDLDVFAVDPEVARTAVTAATAFEEAGLAVTEVAIGLRRDQRELSDVWCRLIVQAHVLMMERLRDEGYDLHDDLPPGYRRWLETGYAMSALDVVRDQVTRSEVFDALQRVLADVDVLVCPTVACLPVPNTSDGDTTGPSSIAGRPVDELIGWCPTFLANFTGHPAASVPAGMVEGLPVGLQIIGRRGADATVLAVSRTLERLRPWTAAYDVCESRPLDASPPTPRQETP